MIQIKQEGTLHLVPLSIIKYLEVTGHYVIYHTAQGDFTEYTTLKEAQKKSIGPISPSAIKAIWSISNTWRQCPGKQ